MRIDYTKNNFCSLCASISRHHTGLYPKQITKCPIHGFMLRTTPRNKKHSAYLKRIEEK